MATWTDGAAYAPIERPDGFATPEVAPLEVAVGEAAVTPGAIPPPRTFQPSAPQPPLDQIRTDPPVTRNPVDPFRTATAALTAGPDAHTVGRDPLQPFLTHTGTVGSQELPPPTGSPLDPPSGVPLPAPPESSLPAPTGPPLPVPHGTTTAPTPTGTQLPPPSGAPLPGQAPTWGTPASQPPDQSTATTLLVVMVVLNALGVILPGAAAWLIFISGLLGLRTIRFTKRLGSVAILTGGSLLVLELIGAAVAGLALLAALAFLGWSAYGLRNVRK